MDLKIKGKNVFVSAGSKGIGRSAVELFLNEGCNVAFCSSNEENVVKAQKEIKKKYKMEILGLVCDINKRTDIIKAIKIVNEKLGAIDILVNNCGGPVPGFFENLTEENWSCAFEQVLMSAVRCTRLVLPAMKAQKWGRIINVTSLSVKQPVDNLLLSNAFRSAVTAFAKTLSMEVGQYNITINNVAPGYTLTSRIVQLSFVKAKAAKTTPEKILESMAEDVPMKRLASAEEVASLIVYLASEQAGYITGTTIGVDGGAIKATY
jgi:3-oxoacyl-[acyl-carrier protein] reductase